MQKTQTSEAKIESNFDLESLPEIPAKRYFTIGEVSKLCLIKPHVLRYWEKEFFQLNPIRRGKRRYYQQTEVVFIRKIQGLLYKKRFTIEGAKSYLSGANQKKESTEYDHLIKQTRYELEKILGLLK